MADDGVAGDGVADDGVTGDAVMDDAVMDDGVAGCDGAGDAANAAEVREKVTREQSKTPVMLRAKLCGLTLLMPPFADILLQHPGPSPGV